MKRKWPFLNYLSPLSVVLILCTSFLEYFTHFEMSLLTWGYILGIFVTVFPENKIHTVTAFVLSMISVLLTLSTASDQEAGVLLETGIFTITGLCLTTIFVFAVIHKSTRAENYRIQMAGIFSYSTQGIVLTDQSGQIILVNSFVEHLFGYANNELKGTGIALLVPEIMLSSSIKSDTNSIRILTPLVIEHQNRFAIRKDRSCFPVEVSMNHYESNGDIFWVVIITDVSIRKQNQDILESQKKELEIVNKELESFSYSVSHDLRSPLRAVGGYAQMLEEDYAEVLDANGKRLLHKIEESAQRMGALIDDLLAFSRLGRKEVQKRRVNMVKLIDVCLSEINLSTRHHAQIVLGELHLVMADPSLLSRVIVNLLSNALKYSAKCEHPRVEINSVIEDKAVIFSIRDNGVGFDMRYVHKLFGVFQRLHADVEFEGTGIGLAIASRIIQKHGGRIWAEGEEGVGACFYFSLPLGNQQLVTRELALAEN